MHYVRKKTCFEHDSMEHKRIRMYIMDFITSRLLLLFPEISENFRKFPKILHFRKFYNHTIRAPASTRDPACIETNAVRHGPACIWDPASIRGNMVTRLDQKIIDNLFFKCWYPKTKNTVDFWGDVLDLLWWIFIISRICISYTTLSVNDA